MCRGASSTPAATASGLIGWGTTLTLEQLGGSLPPEATGPADYEVFRFPPGANPQDYSAVFDPNTGEVLRYELVVGGTVVDIAPKILTFTLGNRTEVPRRTDRTADRLRPDGHRVHLHVGAVRADDLARCPRRCHARDQARRRCGASPPHSRRLHDAPHRRRGIDRRPARTLGEQGEGHVRPAHAGVLVKGSATFNVTRITSASVGAALPVKSGIFKALSTPVDLTGDGRKDRLYFFRPNQTGLTCSSTSVTIGGSLSSGAHWSGTDAVKPVGC